MSAAKCLTRGCTTNSRLTAAFSHAPELPFSAHSRYVCFSDCHRGVGNHGDNFLKNETLYQAALNHYYQEDYVYLELGDGDELWENRSLKRIQTMHEDTFCLLSRFYKEGRAYFLFGNHDIEKQNHSDIQEGLLLKDTSGATLCLTHGHQADFFNSTLWRFSRFLVRYVWRPMELLGFLDPTSAAKNYKKKEKIEKRLTSWAKDNHCILICGHTHRPMMGSPDSPYFNTGSCVHPYGITCLELDGCQITLVKWSLKSRKDGTLYVAREKMADSICIEEFNVELSDNS